MHTPPLDQWQAAVHCLPEWLVDSLQEPDGKIDHFLWISGLCTMISSWMLLLITEMQKEMGRLCYFICSYCFSTHPPVKISCWRFKGPVLSIFVFEIFFPYENQMVKSRTLKTILHMKVTMSAQGQGQGTY
jgi:hypothetical protein